MKNFVAKRVNPILLNLRYLRFKLLKYKENKKMCNTLNVITSNIFLYTECLKKEKLTLLNSLPNEKYETFWGNFHMHGWLKVSSII